MGHKLCKSLKRVVLSMTFCVIGSGLASLALAGPVPFQADYRLVIEGWPDALINHRLSHQGELWQSEMRAALAIAEGEERSRFRIEKQRVVAQSYISGYRMLGMGKRYTLAGDELTELPDRQTALFALSRQADKVRCSHAQAAPCTLRYLDHQGEEETLRYRVIERGEVALPAGAFPSISIDAWNPEKPDRHLLMTFHPDIPGLLLSMAYHRDGARRSRLVLTRLTLDSQAAQPD